MQRTRVPTFLFADYLLRKPAAPKELIILLHGFMQSCSKTYQKLEPICPPDAAVLAVNGPFLVPVRNEDHYTAGYSWYFYNPLTDEYVIDMEIGVDYLAELVRQLGFDDLPTRIIGFSQGGYLAPFFAKTRAKPVQVIGIGCEFLADEIDFPVHFRMDAIHGEKDDTVSAANAERSFRIMRERGVQGEWTCLPGVGHRIDEKVLRVAAELIMKAK